MAPTAPPHEKKPSARTLRHQRVTGQIHPLLPSKIFRPDAAVSDSFLSSKRDKRLIRHSAFLSRVQSSAPNSKISKAGKRRRPGKKIANLDSLGDALPELEEGEDEGQRGKVLHKSLKSRPGALRRKEKIVKGEMQRFGVSMARLAEMPAEAKTTGDTPTSKDQSEKTTSTVEGGQAPAEAATSNRWAALRGYISATMGQNPAFVKKA